LPAPEGADERHRLATHAQLDVERERPEAECDCEVESLHDTIIL
jgi:hypothetical protein